MATKLAGVVAPPSIARISAAAFSRSNVAFDPSQAITKVVSAAKSSGEAGA